MTDKKNPPACRGRGEEKVKLLTDITTTSSQKNQVKERQSEELSEILSRLESKIVRSDEEVDKWERELGRLMAESPVTASVIKNFDRNIKEAAKKPEQLPLGLLPTDFCRTTFCRPIARQEKRPVNDIKQEVFEGPWGRIEYYGPDCAMQEEDLLITIIRKWIENGMKEFGCQYAELLDELGYKRQKDGKHSTRNRRTLKEMLMRLGLAAFRCIFNRGKGKTSGLVTHAISFNWDDKEKILKIDVNKWFVGTIGRGFVTGIDIRERKALRGDIAKALHRFLSSHNDSEGHINVFVLAQVIGMNMKQPAWKIRQLLKLAIRELKRIGFLQEKSRIKDDVLHWHRAHKVLGGPKLVTAIQAPEE